MDWNEDDNDRDVVNPRLRSTLKWTGEWGYGTGPEHHIKNWQPAHQRASLELLPPDEQDRVLAKLPPALRNQVLEEGLVKCPAARRQKPRSTRSFKPASPKPAPVPTLRELDALDEELIRSPHRTHLVTG